MCGIAGYFGKHLISKANINRTLQKMRQRGPDFSNYFSKSYPNNLFIYLLHSRLSIIDLHSRSNQPFIIGDDIIIFILKVNYFVTGFEEKEWDIRNVGNNLKLKHMSDWG